MALHPFRSFQRNQKAWMAGATLLAIISFLFLGVIIQLLDGRGGGQQISTLAETRRFGKFTNYDLDRFRNSQAVLERFLIVLLRNLDQKLALDGVDGEERRQTLAALEGFVNQIAQSQSAEYLVNLWLVTRYMQEEGLSPDWDDAADLLKGLTRDSISEDIYTESRQAVGLSHAQVEQLLAQQIQWQQALMRLDLSVSTISPATRWDWFQRLYRQVTIEAAAVPIDAIIGQVAEPTERQLTAFFEEHKGKRYNPMIAESGFIMPAELAFQYVVDEPSQKLLDSVTEEEMLAFYEENKDTMFRRPTAPMRELPQLPGMMPGMPSGGFPAFPTPGRPVTLTPPGLPDLSDLPSTENAVPETVNSESPAPEVPESPAPEVPESPAHEAPETPAPEAPAAPETETSHSSRVLTRLVSYQADEAGQAEEPAEEPVVADVPQVDAPQADAPQTGETESATVIEERSDEVVEDTKEPAVPQEAVATAQESEETTKAEEAEAEEAEVSQPADLSILYDPFDEVKESIRVMLAREKAVAAFPLIQAKMKEYGNIYHEHFEQEKTIPPMPDLTGFVAEQGLELVTVPRGDVFTAMKTTLARGPQEQRQLAMMFRRMPLLYTGEVFTGSNGQVLYWVTEEKQELKPTSLKEVREVVLQRWKEVEARSLAMKKAEELASEAKASGKSLAEVFAGRNDVPVVTTEPFTWKSYGGLHPSMAMMYRIPPAIGEVRESGVVVGSAEFDNTLIFAPGPDFMEMTYSLEVGEAGVVFNQPQSVVYIVRVTSSSPSTDALWEQFQTTNVLMYRDAGLRELITTSYEAWLDEIRERTGFRWINRPDPLESERFREEF